MQESDTYLMILDEGIEKGIEKGIREVILEQGQDRFGPPDETLKAKLNDVVDVARLKRMARRVPHAVSWNEIIETP